MSRAPMLPGAYLQKRRAMAGYSLSALARDLVVLDGFGRALTASDVTRAQLRLLSAEDSVLHLGARLTDLLRNFVPLDPAVYAQLVDLHETARTEPVPQLCRTCGCSFLDPCLDRPQAPRAGGAAMAHESAVPLGHTACGMVDLDLCSRCVAAEFATPVPPAPVRCADLDPADPALRVFIRPVGTTETEEL